MKTIQVRRVPDGIHQALAARAASAGLSLSEFVRTELERIAERPAVADLLARSRTRAGGTEIGHVVAALRTGRDGP